MASRDSSARKIEDFEAHNTLAILSAIVEGTPDAIFIKDVSGRYIMINAPGAKWLGKDVSEIIGKTDWDLFAPDIAEEFIKSDQKILATGQTMNFDQEFDAGGSHRIVHSVKVPYRDPNGNIRGIIGISRDISGSMESKQQLEKANSLMKATLESTADGILVIDNDENITGYNQNFLDLWKIKKSDIDKHGYEWALKFVLEQLYHPEHCLERIHEIRRFPGEVSFDTLYFKDGRVFERYSRPQRIDGAVVGRVFSYRDVTNETRDRAERENYLALLRTTLDATNDAILVVNTEGRTVTYNKNFLNVWSIPPEIIESRDDAEMIKWVKNQIKSPDEFVKKVEELYKSPSKESFDTIEFKSGRVLERYSRPHRLGDKVVGRVWSFRDVTAKIQAERSLKESEARKAAILASAIDPIITMDRDGKIVELNPAAEKTFGYISSYAIGRSMDSLIIPPRLREAHRRGMERYLGTGESQYLGRRVELPAMRADGTEFPAEVSIIETRLANQFLFTGFIRDISERKHSEALIRHGAAQIRALVEVSRDVIAAGLDLGRVLNAVVTRVSAYFQDGCVIRLFSEDYTRLNTVAFRHFDPKAEEFLRPWFEGANEFIDKGATPDLLKEGRPVSVSGPVEEIRKRIAPELWPVFDHYPVHSWVIVPLRMADQMIGTLTVFRYRSAPSYTVEENIWLQEVADRAALSIDNARLYTDAVQAIQLREDFMSIASHELKTPLTPLKMQLQLLSHLVQTGVMNVGPLEDKLKKVISDSDQQIVRLSRLVDDILDATRLRTGQFALQREIVDLNSVVAGAIDRLKESKMSGANAIEFHPGQLKAGFWDRLRLEQVVTNLISNALKFGAGKAVIVKTSMQDGYAFFSVKDFGIGIAKESHKKIFERLERAVSVKQYGGLGMGLFIARQIVDLHGGRILVESSPGAGSTFTVELPFH
ncbi:MAG: PAS domain S-box protein [Bdellovibrionia bacterium]